MAMKIQEEHHSNRILFDISPLAMWIYDPQKHKIIAVNTSYKERFSDSYRNHAFLGKDVDKEIWAFLNDSISPKKVTSAQAIQESDIYTTAITWEGISACLFYLKEARPLINKEDILVETLKKNQNFAIILEILPDEEFKIIDVSIGLNEAKYISPKRFIGKGLNKLFNDHTLIFLKEKLQECIRRGEPIEFNFHGNFEGFGRKIYHINVEPNFDTSKQVKYLAAVGKDITERYMALEDQSFQSKIINSIGQGIISCNLQGTIIFVNEHTSHVLGYEKEELIGKDIRELFVKSAELDAFFFQLGKKLSQNESSSIETHMLTKSGQYLNYFITTSALYDKKGKLKGFVGIGTDLTGIKEKEQELKSKTDQLKYALESADMVSWIYDLKNEEVQRIGPVNKIMGELPLSSPEFVASVIHPIDRERISAAMDAAKKGKPFFETYRIIRPNGEIRWVEDSGKMEFDEHGRPLRLGGIMQDVTTEKIKEDIIRDSEFTLNSLLNNTSQSFFLLDKDQTILKLNLEAKKLFEKQGVQINEGQAFKSIIHQNDIEAFSLNFDKALKGISSETETTLIVGDEKRHYLLNYNPAYSTSNQVTGVVFSVTDITENKKYQKELEKLSLVASKTVNGVVIMDEKGKIEWVNEGFTRITKYSLEEVIGEARTTTLFGAETEMGTINQYFKKLESKKSFSIELFTHDKFGDHLWLNINITPILNRDGEVKKLIAIESDITDKKLREEERVKLIDELTKQNTNLKQFSYIVSHNVRKPVANILGLYALMEMNDMGGEEREELIQYIGNSIVELDQVINDLNNILDIRDNFDQTKTYVKFEDVIQKVIGSLKEEIKKNNSKISFEQVEVDGVLTIPGYFQSILYNLISNSIKYRQPNLEPQVEIATLDKGEFVEIVVRDNGLGMNLPQIESSLFGLYKRFHHHIEGKGLGLYMIKTQTEAMGGKIEVSSKVNEGTTFSVFLRR